MVEQRQINSAISPASSACPDFPSHRQILSNIDKPSDATSDNDGTTDDEAFLSPPQDDGEASSIIGISISHAQIHMKSTRTPAYEKAQALEKSRGYFEAEPTAEDGAEIELTDGPEDEVKVADSRSFKTELPTFPWRSQIQQNTRSSMSRAILSGGQNEGRKRSLSGPAAILEGLRKMLPDFPSYAGFGSNSKDDADNVIKRFDQDRTESGVKIRSHRSQSIAQPSSHHISGTGLDGSLQSIEQSGLRPVSLRRSTSDHSLYLRKAVTGASEFDNTNAFASVAEMPNSRFKAITDSLADSSLKMPKLPNMSFSSSRNLASRTNSDVTKQNTAFNTGSLQNSGSFDNGPSRPREKNHPVLTEALSHLTGDLVLMGGYRGSVLRLAEPPHHQVWVPVKVGLNLRKVDLELGLTHEDEKKSEEKIISSGILAHIGPIDIARRLLKKINKSPNVKAGQLRIHNYGYDWRLSPHYLSQQLIKFLEGLECNRPNTPTHKRGALVVAHSLGGLITRHAVNLRPELFSGVVYLGTPQNCCNILGPLRNGDDVFLSSRVLTAQVNFTLRTSYALLPENGRCFINKETGERYDVDFFNITTWEEHCLSPCISTPLPPFSTQPRKSLMDSISETISSFTPNITSKRSSWFSSSASTTTEPTTTDTLKDKAQDIKEEVESAAKTASEGISSPKHEIQDSLEPSMKPSQQQHNKPSVATAVTIPRDQAREYLTRTLAEIKQFKAELSHVLAHQDANRYPPHALIFGKSVPTVYGAKVASREAIKCADAYDDLAFAAGDGVVLASAAQLPVGYRCVKGGRVESDRGHIGLLGDLEAIGKCIAAVVEGRRRGVGLGKLD